MDHRRWRSPVRVGKYKGIEVGRRVTSLAGNRAGRHVIARERLDGRRADKREPCSVAGDAVGREARVIHRRDRVRNRERREIGGRVAVLTRGRADRNVIGRLDDGCRRADERQAARVTGVAGQGRHHRVVHRRGLVRDLERREVRRRMAGLTGGRAEGNVIARRHLERRWCHVREGEPRGVALRAIARDVHVIHRCDAVVAAGVAQRTVAVVGGRQRYVIRRQIRRACEARRIEVAGTALAENDVRRSVRLVDRTHDNRRRADEALARFVASRTCCRGHGAVNHRRRCRAARVADDEGIEIGRRMAALARGGASWNVIGRFNDGRRRADEGQTARVTGGAAQARDRRVVHRRAGVGDQERSEVGRRVAALARRCAERNVIHGRRNRPRRADETEAARVAGGARRTRHRRVVHRRTRVGDHEAREIGWRVAAVAGRSADGHVIARQHLERGRSHVRKALACAVTDGAGSGDRGVIHRVKSEIR